MATVSQRRAGPVRPSRGVVESVVSALALPGVGPVTLAQVLGRARERARGSSFDPVAAARAFYGMRRRALPSREQVRVDGWVRRIMETIDHTPLHVLMPGHPGYPTRLGDLREAPPILFAQGRLELLDGPLVGVVGTRRSSDYGRRAATRMAGGLARAGVTVVSGLAAGIDTAAHRAAGTARTIGVLGCGIDVPYPRRNAELQRAIGREGLLLSEQLPGTPPMRHTFPERNRIIAALCSALVVVEAPEGSGALITANQADALSRQVFVVPGPLGSPGFEGANARIRDGARLLTGPGEVLAYLELPAPEGLEADTPPPDLTGVGLALWRALGPEPRHVDEVAGEAGLDPHHGLASLLALEIQGYARQLPGMRFVRESPAEVLASAGTGAEARSADRQ